jgi:signal transduction histidine kinase
MWLDARETLGAFMTGDMPDAQRFRAVIGGALDRARRGMGDVSVQAYGEMVDLLWSEGNAAGAIALEELWNELAGEQPFALLCAYALDGFADTAHTDVFASICGQHARVCPTERYARADDVAREREVSLLQQRSLALDAEVARRRTVEAELQEHRTASREAVNRAKSEFLAAMSHELRTPLNAIAGYADLLELGVHGPVTDTQREILARIQKSQAHLLGLINDVLNYTRVETGTVPYATRDAKIGDTVAAVVSLMAPQFEAKGLRLVTEPRASEPETLVRADVEKVEQILHNLLSNALRFTNAGGVTVSYGVSGRSHVCVQVRDTGIGIAAEKLETVFEPFVQVKSGFTRQYDGTGLGLAISRDLARAMGGDLTAESTVGVGSTFTLTLPRAD